MASGRWLSHTLFQGLGGEEGRSLGPSPVLSLIPPSNPQCGTQWSFSFSSRQPVCPAIMPDAEINTSHNSIVFCFPKLLSVILESGISLALGQFRGLEGLRDAVPKPASPVL